MTPARSRRRFLAAVAAAGLTGCTGPNGAGTTNREGTGATDTDPELDFREANVVGVSVEADGDRYRFDVTLHHDDAGEDGYADWWQVERPDGSRVGRRDLLHPHAEQPFARSDTFAVGGDPPCLVVRGHDRTHGYGGRAVLVDLTSGATRAVDQGPEPRPLGAADCLTPWRPEASGTFKAGPAGAGA